ncbi:hypothetical protein JCM11251_000064 [Rhodosporidiobolus azoricus]
MADLAVYAGGALVRLLLAHYTPLPALLQHRTELSTPLSSWTRLKEGHTLFTGLSPLTRPQTPYSSGGSFHHSPLALLLLGPLTDAQQVPEWVSYAVWTLADLGVAWAVGRVADRRRRRELLVEEGKTRWSAKRVSALYLFHPFSLFTTLARSSITFSNLSVALAVESAISGSIIPAVFFLSFATHLSLYPILLLPPLVLLAHTYRQPPSPSVAADEPSSRSFQAGSSPSLQSSILEGVSGFAVHQGALLGLSWYLTGHSWSFLSSAYGVNLTIPDLTPNIGLSWYFFIEMFDHFRAFFLVVFALHPVVYVAPLTYFYRKDPLLPLVLLVGSSALLKPYPALGDWGLWHALLGCYSELIPYIPSPLFHLLLPLHALFLLPTFHHLWLVSGSGNSNFFYASTLVWAIGMGGWIVEVMKGWGRREVVGGLGKEGRERVRKGEWEVVQR